MKKYITCALLTCVLGFQALAGSQASGEREQLAELDRKLNEAIYRGDVSVLQDLLADDWYATTALREFPSKTEWLEQTRRGANPVLQYSYGRATPGASDRRTGPGPAVEVSPGRRVIRTYGDTAVVSGFLSEKVPARQSKSSRLGVSSPYRYVNVYMKRGGRWLAISTHIAACE